MTDTHLVERLRGLIERLEKLEGPDREIDAEINGLSHGGRVHLVDLEDGVVVWEKPIDGMWVRRILKLSRVPRYTASLDAAVALVERVLPGWSGVVDFGTESPIRRADLYSPVKEMGEDEYGNPVEIRDDAGGEGSTPAIALLIAALRALSQEPSK